MNTLQANRNSDVFLYRKIGFKYRAKIFLIKNSNNHKKFGTTKSLNTHQNAKKSHTTKMKKCIDLHLEKERDREREKERER